MVWIINAINVPSSAQIIGNRAVGNLLIISYSSMASIANENCNRLAPDNGVPDIYGDNIIKRDEECDILGTKMNKSSRALCFDIDNYKNKQYESLLAYITSSFTNVLLLRIAKILRKQPQNRVSEFSAVRSQSLWSGAYPEIF